MLQYLRLTLQGTKDLHFTAVPVLLVATFSFLIAHCMLSVYEVRSHWPAAQTNRQQHCPLDAAWLYTRWHALPPHQLDVYSSLCLDWQMFVVLFCWDAAKWGHPHQTGPRSNCLRAWLVKMHEVGEASSSLGCAHIVHTCCAQQEKFLFWPEAKLVIPPWHGCRLHAWPVCTIHFVYVYDDAHVVWLWCFWVVYLQSKEDLHYFALPVLLVSIFSFLTAHCFLSVYEVSMCIAGSPY